MSGELIVHKNRTNIVLVSLGFDVSGETITSEIRKSSNHLSTRLATWVVTFDTDGTNGKVILTLPQSEVDLVSTNYGFMDLKRMSGSNALSVFLEPLKVKFQGVVTA